MSTYIKKCWRNNFRSKHLNFRIKHLKITIVFISGIPKQNAIRMPSLQNRIRAPFILICMACRIFACYCISMFFFLLFNQILFLLVISDLAGNVTRSAAYDLHSIMLTNINPQSSYDVCLRVTLANNQTLSSDIQTIKSIKHAGKRRSSF